MKYRCLKKYIIVFICVMAMISSTLLSISALNNITGKKTITFYIEETPYIAQEGWDWADWILSYGISAGDNGIAWIGYDTHPNMSHGYIYYWVEGNDLGENTIEYNGKHVKFTDDIEEAVYTIGGDKEFPLGIDELQVLYDFKYYSSLNDAINSVNETKDIEDSNIGTYIDSFGKMNIVLLNDMLLDTTISIKKI